MQVSEEAAQINLTRTRRLATGLLVLMAVVFIAGKLMERRYPFLSFVTAFAEAAMVGALADWFAVTALFRSPLGLPIPHTAIIPRNKERIGESLAHFLQHNFITQEIIRDELRPIDFAGVAANWLARPENSRMIAAQFVKSIPSLLRVVEDEDIARFARNRLSAALENVQLAPVIAEALALLATNQRHQALFDHLIDFVARAVEHNKPYIRWKIHQHSPRWLPKAVDEKFFERLVDAIQSTLWEMKEDDSEWRTRFHYMTQDFIEKLRSSESAEERIKSIVTELLAHPMFQDYTNHVWHDIKQRMLADAEAADSQMVARLDQACRGLSEALLDDQKARAKLNQWLRIFATEAIVSRRAAIADLVSKVIRKWDAETVSRKLELHVGKDLQYIRINGTLVGGLVGLLLHLISLAL